MPRLRSVLGRLTMVWLLVQSTAPGIAPAILWSAAADAVACTCSHGDHTVCPMHHPPSADSRHCGMRGLADVESGVIVSLLGPVAPVTERRVQDIDTLTVAALPPGLDAHSFRSAPPDPPPPRA